MVSALERRGGAHEAPEWGGGVRDELGGSQVQLQTEELRTRLIQAACGRPRRRGLSRAARRAGRLRRLGLWGGWVGSRARSRSPPHPLRPRPLTTRRPHPRTSLWPTSCLRPSGPGSTSFAKLGSPRPWQEVPSRPALSCFPRWPLEASLLADARGPQPRASAARPLGAHTQPSPPPRPWLER